MSYGNVKRATHEASKPAESIGRCYASNCPCKGTMSHGGDRFFCAAHAFADADMWPRITEKLRTHDWLIAFHDDMQRMDRRCEDWRGFAVQFWAGQEDAELLQPDPKEGAVPYQNRMRGELSYRCGLSTRPAVRLPQELKGRRGTFVNGEPMRKAA